MGGVCARSNGSCTLIRRHRENRRLPLSLIVRKSIPFPVHAAFTVADASDPAAPVHALSAASSIFEGVKCLPRDRDGVAALKRKSHERGSSLRSMAACRDGITETIDTRCCYYGYSAAVNSSQGASLIADTTEERGPSAKLRLRFLGNLPLGNRIETKESGIISAAERSSWTISTDLKIC